jgi:hypothetical protein
MRPQPQEKRGELQQIDGAACHSVAPPKIFVRDLGISRMMLNVRDQRRRTVGAPLAGVAVGIPLANLASGVTTSAERCIA